MKIVNTKAKITKVKDLSPTGREISIRPETAFDFTPGMFVNIFMDEAGKSVRRAFSISSDRGEGQEFTISVRLLPDGEMSPLFWRSDVVGRQLRVMGPMGFNTSDKLTKDKVFLFAFGIGASVIKAVAHELLARKNIKELVIMTGNSNEDEIIYKDFFDSLARSKKHISVSHVLSRPKDESYPKTGYIQNFIENLDFNDASVYMCGGTKACDSLKEEIEAQNPQNCEIVVEAFG